MSKGLDVITELDAGIFVSKITAALQAAGLAAVNHGKQSKIALTLSFDQIDNSQQVSVTHKIVTTIPHLTGKNTDEDTKKTPLHVHTDGGMSIFTESQFGFSFTKATEEV